MSLRTGVRVQGVQTPRFSLEPSAPRSDADDAAFLSSSYGLIPDEWQHTVLRSWLGVSADGRWASTRCGLAVPRQNGKNGVLEIRELFGMIALGEKFLHTAHEVKTARKAFMRLKSFFENERRYPELAALVAEIRLTNGQEAIILNNGGSCEFVARSKGSGRGFTVDVLVLDEAQELGDDALEALLPTISASPLQNPQQIFTGTPPGPRANGEIFARVRGDGLARTDKRLSWHEWSCEPDADLDDLQNLARSNPALGIRVQQDIAEAERGSLSDDGYGRERLGIWPRFDAHEQVIPLGVWTALSIPDAEVPLDPPAYYALAMSPDRIASIAVAVRGVLADYVDLAEMSRVDDSRKLIDWFVKRCGRRIPVMIDSRDPAASMVNELRSRGVKVNVSTATDAGKACGGLLDAVKEARVQHCDQPAIRVALVSAKKLPVGKAGLWEWDIKDLSPEMAALRAITLARFGLSFKKRPSGNGRSSSGRTAVLI